MLYVMGGAIFLGDLLKEFDNIITLLHIMYSFHATRITVCDCIIYLSNHYWVSHSL